MLKSNEEQIKEKFFNLKTREDVAELLEIKEKSLRYFLYVLKPEKLYKSFYIKKKNGSVRSIHAPVKKLKMIQKRPIAKFLMLTFYFPISFLFLRKCRPQNLPNFINSLHIVLLIF